MLISIGTLLAGLSWVLASYAHSTSMLYLTYGCVGGLGTGIVYVGVVGFEPSFAEPWNVVLAVARRR